METKNEILRICNDGKVFLHGKLVDEKNVKEVLSTLVNYVPEQEVQEELPKKGQVVWVRDNDGQRWVITHFKEKEDNRYFCSAENNYNEAIGWNQLTTKNPYEVEEDREPQIGDMVYAWSDLKHGFVYGELQLIESSGYPYIVKYHGGFKHCSLKNPLIK